MNLTKKAQIIGVYRYLENEPIYLIEMMITESPSKVDLAKFLQKDDCLPMSDWQVAYDEHFLNNDGTEIIGDFFNQAELNEGNTRVVFFMYIEDIKKPLLTPYGEMSFLETENLPQRLARIVSFTPFD